MDPGSKDVIRRTPSGRYTEAEARYIAGRILAGSNGGYVPAHMRQWWLSIDAIAPAWLTSESILFQIPASTGPAQSAV
jgi:hypothetical protein